MISAATGQGTGPLMRRAGQLLLELKKAEPLPEQVQELVLPKRCRLLEEFTVTQVDGEFVVEGGPGAAHAPPGLEQPGSCPLSADSV